MLRPVPIQHYLDAMHRRGFTSARLLAGTTIEPHALQNPGYLIDDGDYLRFIENLIDLSGDQGIGLAIGLEDEAAHYGILAYSGLSCSTLRQGVETVWSKYGQAFGIMSTLRLHPYNADTAGIEVIAQSPSDAVYRFVVEEALCILSNIGGSITGLKHQPFECIELAYPAPSYSTRYSEIFECEVRFDAQKTRVLVGHDWLDSPLLTTDAELNQICRQHLEHVLRMVNTTGPLEARVRRLLLGRPNMSLREAAEEIGLSARTLARRLQEEGTSYRRLVESTRCELARNWLRAGHLTTKEIGFKLGFRDVSAFRRAFKAWTGRSVGVFRSNRSLAGE